ncbi:MAG TPA: hypothetical protein VEG38_10065 [Acidimicrobiia bacterium]|nr:hypothetical protein [Acidimicrobiia bacterium]
MAEEQEDPSVAGEDPQVVGEPLETEDGVRVPAQQNVGPGVEEGGGEWPDPNTPPKLPAPGAAEDGDVDAEDG